MSEKATLAYGPGSASADPAFRKLAEDLYRERVEAARNMPPEEKLLAGEELFDYACAITLAGIREQSAGLSEDDYMRILKERLDLREQMEKRG